MKSEMQKLKNLVVANLLLIVIASNGYMLNEQWILDWMCKVSRCTAASVFEYVNKKRGKEIESYEEMITRV